MSEKLDILIGAGELERRIRELGEQITADYQDKELHLVGILKGSVFFLADLARQIGLPCTLDFMTVSSYGNQMMSSGRLQIKKDLDEDIRGREVLLIEDIIDTGYTLSNLKPVLLERGPQSLKICTLLDKPERRRVPLHADYTGFTVPDEFVVGYGLDFDQRYRNLPYIGKLEIMQE